MLILRALLRLTRLDSSVLAFLAVFFPLWVRTGNLAQSLGRAIPMLFTYMCAFIANDLDDVEKDRVNHPDRPLPSGYITPAFAAILYFTCLALALFLTRHYVPPTTAFLYYALISLHISYGYLVEVLPGLKAPYVGAMNTIPILIVATLFPETKLYVAASSILFLVLGREICMDIRDRPGDDTSFMHGFRPARLAAVGFSLQLIGLFMLASQVRGRGDVVALLAMASVLALSAYFWFKSARHRLAIIVMKLQWFVGLYFLM
jgi:geranylgeranylglycerol-phosphate geranylgeranyltransferase